MLSVAVEWSVGDGALRSDQATEAALCQPALRSGLHLRVQRLRLGDGHAG